MHQPDRQKKTILFLAANPQETPERRLGEELRQSELGLGRSRLRDQFRLEQKWAVQPIDLRRAMLELEPQIVHFAGQGAGEQGLVLEDEAGQVQRVGTEALANLFKLFGQVECVVLNACYSELQAKAIAQHIPYVIGMHQAIGERHRGSLRWGFMMRWGRDAIFRLLLSMAALASAWKDCRKS